MKTPQNLKYSKTHEWIRLEGDTAVIGITDYAQDQLGDIVFIELSASGKQIKTGEPFGSIESVKSVSELISPLSGEITTVNAEAVKTPEGINKDPYEKNWMIKLKISQPSEMDTLMDTTAYRLFTGEDA
jgi:glycine cleavage system H protein